MPELDEGTAEYRYGPIKTQTYSRVVVRYAVFGIAIFLYFSWSSLRDGYSNLVPIHIGDLSTSELIQLAIYALVVLSWVIGFGRSLKETWSQQSRAKSVRGFLILTVSETGIRETHTWDVDPKSMLDVSWEQIKSFEVSRDKKNRLKLIVLNFSGAGGRRSRSFSFQRNRQEEAEALLAAIRAHRPDV